ncbi:rhomboid family intramembrane serine protease [Paracoccus sp. PXZ]
MAVWSVVGISLLAFLYQSGLPPRALNRFLFDFALVPSRVFGQLRHIAPSDWTPFLTNIFLHAGWLHLILNMWTLWIFGPAVEDRLGPVRFALFYLFCGVAAGLAHALANPDSVVPALGASGAIAGVASRSSEEEGGALLRDGLEVEREAPGRPSRRNHHGQSYQEDPEAVLEEITGYLRAARSSLAGGAALPGPDTGGDYDDLAFALPANASATYCKRKMPAATERLGEVAQVWEAE